MLVRCAAALYAGSMQRLMSSLGLRTVRSLMVCWAVSAVVLILGLIIALTGNSMGLVLFVLGAAGSLFTAFGMLALRAGERGDRPK